MQRRDVAVEACAAGTLLPHRNARPACRNAQSRQRRLAARARVLPAQHGRQSGAREALLLEDHEGQLVLVDLHASARPPPTSPR